MANTLSCKNVGMVGCDFTAKADTVEELMQAAAAHAKTAHGLDSIPPELLPMVQAAVRDE
jgi:predicted small metal-binding protein